MLEKPKTLLHEDAKLENSQESEKDQQLEIWNVETATQRSKRERKAKSEILQASQTQAPNFKKKQKQQQQQTISTPAAEAQGSNNCGLLTTLQKTHQSSKK